MATEVTVELKKDSRQVKFDGGMAELLPAIVKTFTEVLTSVEDIDNLMVYDSEVEDFVMLKNSSCKILNGASFKVVLKKVRIRCRIISIKNIRGVHA